MELIFFAFRCVCESVLCACVFVCVCVKSERHGGHLIFLLRQRDKGLSINFVHWTNQNRVHPFPLSIHDFRKFSLSVFGLYIQKFGWKWTKFCEWNKLSNM